ncbi:hypothetical protein [Solirubrum puertoriconensis]|uniref:Uncharacterized protein n=1 Tax=Solirubrum puertoriconensis TaxID=1751427 RepID=A0A9X0HN93_SOLP1|nr:hypothetical protein [Solirubrum puertoriconensis]KUG09121.1 hypothetical protein ASU33_20095 [Solirubrum puertoriconensis]
MSYDYKGMIAVTCMALLYPVTVVAQMPDRAQYQSSFDDCNAERNKMVSELTNMRAEKETILREYRQGQFCSDCRRSKTEVERQDKISFGQHIASAKGRHIISATQEQLNAKEQELNDKIHQKEVDVDSKRLDCEKIASNYQQAHKQAVDEEQRRFQEEQAAEQNRRLAEQARQQALMDASLERLNQRLAENSAETDRRLAEFRATSRMDNLPAYDKDYAQSLQVSNKNELADKAFDGGQNQYLVNSTKEYLIDKLNSLKDAYLDQFKEQANIQLFGSDYNDRPESNTQVWSFEDQVRSDIIHNIKSRILQWDKAGSGVLSKIYEPYRAAQAELSLYEERTLDQFNEENTNFMMSGINGVTTTEDEVAFSQNSETFMANVPKRFIGVLRKWLTRGRYNHVDELIRSNSPNNE